MECPYHKLRDDLPPLTERIKKLPVDKRGYPIPAFVQWIEIVDGKPKAVPDGQGEPDFRVVKMSHLHACYLEDLCWVCGEKLGQYRAYVIGPMCAVNRNSAEPPSHVECAEWSAKACPFLTKPNMRRREDEISQSAEVIKPAGFMEEANPGVNLIWTVKGPTQIRGDDNGGILFDVGNPETVTWWKEGRPATNEEAISGLQGSIDRLLKLCDTPEERNWVMQKRDEVVANLRRAG
jgi:hypothetical protein